MKHKKMSVNHLFHPVAILPTAVLSVGLAMSVPAAHATIMLPDEIIVTARRTEEVIQNVPISMTVYNQDMLNERNVVSGADLATYTPSLSVNTRFGADNTTFAIRGFTQELRTTASVAVYFADVVAPRGGGSISSGDGAGPGSFFDLQNVQVLKGPQGTLFGRNTTGGAILLVPHEPTTKLEGYLEQSAGNYNMRRTQGVINVPITDNLRARFGFDTEKRDGYLNNVTGIGPDRLADKNYVAARGTVVWDVTDTVKNSTIYSYTNSSNKGTIQGLFACNPEARLASVCNPALSALGSGFYNVANEMPDPETKLKQWQVINTTTWEVNDNLIVKNNLSYAELQTTNRFTNFGANFQLGGSHIWLFPAGTWQGIPSNSQKTYVEELQFSGTALDTKLTWQSGLYYERSRPDGITGALSPSFAVCDPASGDPSAWNCPSIFPGGGVVSTLGTIEYINKAVYAEGTYDISDQFIARLGVRYTDDETKGDSLQTSYAFDGAGQLTGSNCVILGADPTNGCSFKSNQHSEAPTWLIDFDYLPTPDVMIYAKYARGYRQGSVSTASPAGFQTFDPEKVDAYEIGAKTSFKGPVPGTFNVALFYNELKDQQLQMGEVPCSLNSDPDIQCTPAPAGFAGSATTAIVNAGASTIQGVDVETTLKLLDDLVFNLSYEYLSTHLDTLKPVPGAAGYAAIPSAEEGGHLSFSPTHSLATGLSYRLPIPADWGDMSAGATYTFISDQISTEGSLGTLPARQLLNLNMGWKGVLGSAFDAAVFVTNALNEEYATYVPGVYDSLGAEFRVVGEPKMVGARVKYSFK